MFQNIFLNECHVIIVTDRPNKRKYFDTVSFWCYDKRYSKKLSTYSHQKVTNSAKSLLSFCVSWPFCSFNCPESDLILFRMEICYVKLPSSVCLCFLFWNFVLKKLLCYLSLFLCRRAENETNSNVRSRTARLGAVARSPLLSQQSQVVGRCPREAEHVLPCVTQLRELKFVWYCTRPAVIKRLVLDVNRMNDVTFDHRFNLTFSIVVLVFNALWCTNVIRDSLMFRMVLRPSLCNIIFNKFDSIL